MNEPSLKKSVSSNSISSAPRRPKKLGSVQSIVGNETNKNNPSPFEEITLSDDDFDVPAESVKCSTCSRDMTPWNNSRRDIHIKVCKAKRADEQKAKTIARKSNAFTKTIEKNDYVREKAFQEPREHQKFWEFSKNDIKFARIAADDEENRKRKRPRSFAVVELAPKKCQCEILTTLHSKFIDEFHSKSLKKKEGSEKGITEHAFQMKKMIEKLSRYEQLSWDMRKTLDDTSDLSSSHITIISSDGHRLKCHSLILKHRTSVLKLHPNATTINIDQSKEALELWLNFVFTANMEWNYNMRSVIYELSAKYGPVGLENLVKESLNTRLTNVEIKSLPEIKDNKTENQFHRVDSIGGEAPRTDCVPDTSSENIIEINETVNYFTSDDPFIGFGKVSEDEVMDEQNEEDEAIIVNDNVHFSASSTRRMSESNIPMDSFDEWSNQPSHVPSTSSPAVPSTPVRNVSKRNVFGSNVKILKTNDITPMPQFDTMDEAELKERMKEIGMRPKGKKTMIQILKKAYNTLHPEVCSGTPTVRPLIRSASLEKVSELGAQCRRTGKLVSLKSKTLSERLMSSPKNQQTRESTEDVSGNNFSNDFDDADKTLNISNDERDIGKLYCDDIGEEDEDTAATSNTSSGKSDVAALKISFLTWLRSDLNAVLHEHILSLQPVSLEEMLIRLEKAEGPLGRIGKGKLVKVLEMLNITYQLPQKTGRARGGFKRRL